jgi:tetratricopeptide (TPR) repeat protein
MLPDSTDIARTPLVTLYPMPDANYHVLDGSPRSLPLGSGKNVLLNLWSASCRPCLAELKEFGQREKEIRDAGIEILALNVDLLRYDLTHAKELTTTLAKSGYPFSAGTASPRLLNMLQFLHDFIIWLDKPLALPSSFLVDEDGRLAVIYKGRLSVDQLLADVRHSKGSLAERHLGAALLPGRLLEDEVLSAADTRFHVLQFFRMARLLNARGLPFNEVKHFRHALKVNPDDVETHKVLGNLLAKEGNLQDALTHYQQVARIEPASAQAHNNLVAMLDRLGRTAEAAEHYREAVTLEPNHFTANYNLGLALANSGQLEAAAAQLRKVIELDPNHIEARKNLEIVLQRIGRAAPSRKNRDTQNPPPPLPGGVPEGRGGFTISPGKMFRVCVGSRSGEGVD